MLARLAACSEKLATRMLYVFLFRRIQSHAAMTSATVAVPSSFITSSETSFALGATPAIPSAAPAAIPATNVPCPNPSPGESAPELAKFACAITRPPKSARFASIPESTIAIVGARRLKAWFVQSTGACVTHAHFCGFDCGRPTALIVTASFGTMAPTNFVRASARICRPVSISSSPSTDRNSRRSCPVATTARNASSSRPAPVTLRSLDWTITSKD